MLALVVAVVVAAVFVIVALMSLLSLALLTTMTMTMILLAWPKWSLLSLSLVLVWLCRSVATAETVGTKHRVDRPVNMVITKRKGKSRGK